MKSRIASTRRKRSTWAGRLALAVGVALGSAAIFDAGATIAPPAAPMGQASGVGALATVARPAAVRNGDVIVRALPLTQPIRIVVVLKLRNRQALDAAVADMARSQASGQKPRLMTSDQVIANHSPTSAQAQTVVRYLSSMGFRNVAISPDRQLVMADGTAATAERAFSTSMAQIKTHDGRIAFANTEAVRIPASLQGIVHAVLGLQTVHVARTQARVVPLSAHTNAITYHYPHEFSSIYGGTGVADASNVTVGIFTEGNLTQVIDDLSLFYSEGGGRVGSIQTVNTGGTSNDTSGTLEWDLDSQSIIGMAGGNVGTLIFYNVPSLTNADITADFDTVKTANQVKIFSASIGICETDALDDGTAAAEDAIFEEALAQGQTFVFATGDSGADECGNGGTTPYWPASSQYVIAAAGTTLNASTTTWGSEVVWNDLASKLGATGGSPSKFEPMPSWQKSFGVPGTTRGAADIAFDGDPNSGAVIWSGAQQYLIGGTSLSTPLFAGMWARVIAVEGTGVGFAGPLLYHLPASDLHDITVGNNNGETAKVGYDFASGRGSIILSKAIADIGGVGPIAIFGFTTSGLTAHFTDSSTDNLGTITSHAWTFGDGSTSTAISPSHVFGASGAYSVSDTVRDNHGASSTRTATVAVYSNTTVAKDLVYTPIAPCRIVDTRYQGGLPIAGGTERDFIGYESSGTYFLDQGGSGPGTCFIPPDPSALVVHVTAVSPTQAGYLTVWPYGTSQPLASSLNYAAGTTVGNEILAGMQTNPTSYQFSVFSSATTHVVVDALGYFMPPLTTAPACTNVQSTLAILAGNAASLSAVCPATSARTGGSCGNVATDANLQITSSIPGSSSGIQGWSCAATNTGANTETLQANAICCVVP